MLPDFFIFPDVKPSLSNEATIPYLLSILTNLSFLPKDKKYK